MVELPMTSEERCEAETPLNTFQSLSNDFKVFRSKSMASNVFYNVTYFNKVFQVDAILHNFAFSAKCDWTRLTLIIHNLLSSVEIRDIFGDVRPPRPIRSPIPLMQSLLLQGPVSRKSRKVFGPEKPFQNP